MANKFESKFNALFEDILREQKLLKNLGIEDQIVQTTLELKNSLRSEEKVCHTLVYYAEIENHSKMDIFWRKWIPDANSKSTILFVDIDRLGQFTKEMLSHFQILCSQYIVIIVFDPLEKVPLEQDESRLIYRCKKEIEIDQYINKVFGHNRLFESLKTLKAISIMDGLENWTEQYVEKENLQLRSKRSIQTASQIKLNAEGYNPANRSTENSFGRNQIQQLYSSFEEIFRTNHEKYFHSNRGIIIKKIQDAIPNLDELTKKSLSKTDLFTLPESYWDTLIGIMQENAQRSMVQDLDSLNLLYQKIINELKMSNDALGDQLSGFIRSPLSVENIQQVIAPNVKSDRPFELSVNHKKTMDYVMGARMYYMLPMMIFSMFGISSVVRKNPEIFIPGLFLTLGFGIYKIWSTIELEKHEIKEKQLTQAKDYAKNEIQKLISEISKAWEKLYLDRNKSTINSAIFQIDEFYDQNNRVKRQQNEHEKSQLNQFSNNLTLHERNVENYYRNFTNVTRSYKRLKSDLFQNIKDELQNL